MPVGNLNVLGSYFYHQMAELMCVDAESFKDVQKLQC